LMDILIEKMDRQFRANNPFKKDMYVLDSMTYLYNRNLIRTYNRNIKFDINEERSGHNLPKNKYRINR